MPKEAIKLGDEIEDITAKVKGVAIGRIEYLDGTTSWIMQPPSDPDGLRVSTVEVVDAYVRRVGDGVRATAKPPMGFHAREVKKRGSN